MRTIRSSGVVLAGAIAGGLVYRMVVRGELTLDLGVGRRLQDLGPLTRTIDADRETVFDVIAAPYLGRTPRAMADEIEVLERGTDVVLAAHRTPAGRGLVATTVETVRFERPERVTFRLVRGPVPHVVETFTLVDDGGSTRLDYSGQLGTDFGAVGSWWGALVAGKWVATVDASLTGIAAESERRARVRTR
jgi:hypothetical protein